MKNLEFNLQIIPTKKQICAMCHCSSGCHACCKICQKNCNGGQICGLLQPPEDQIDRLEAWINIVNTNENYLHLKNIFKLGGGK